MNNGIRVAISAITWDEIVDSWGDERGLGRQSPRWSGERLAVASMSADEAAALKQYLQGRLGLIAGPGIDRLGGEAVRLRRDISRISGV